MKKLPTSQMAATNGGGFWSCAGLLYATGVTLGIGLLYDIVSDGETYQNWIRRNCGL